MKLNNLIIIGFAFFVIIAVTGCTSIAETTVPIDYNTTHVQPLYDKNMNYRGNVYFVHDDERNVSCWITTLDGYSRGAGGGISCIPDEQLSTP